MPQDTSQGTVGTDRTVTSPDGTPIAYRSTGTGPPLVMVHGTTADHTRWAPLLPSIEPHMTVHAMDRRGRGASGDGPSYSLDREFEDVVAVVEDVAARVGSPVNVYGHSYGALCSLGAASLGASIGKLVVYEPPGRAVVESAPSGILERIEAMLEHDDREGALSAFFTEVVGMSAGELEAFRQMPAWAARVAAAHTIAREEAAPAGFDAARAADVTVPTLMIMGSDSPAPLKQDTQAVAARLPDVRIATLAGQQHIGDVMAPEAFCAELLGFLGV